MWKDRLGLQLGSRNKSVCVQQTRKVPLQPPCQEGGQATEGETSHHKERKIGDPYSMEKQTGIVSVTQTLSPYSLVEVTWAR